ncbi:MAG: DUF5681 domain-containing protein [Isosphaeraceae bacterium]
MNPNGTPKNLVPAWQRGESGNPNGRLKGPTLTTLIRRVLEGKELYGEPTPGNRIVADCLAESMILHAIKGNAAYMREILDCVEGPVRAVVPESGGSVVCYIPRANSPRDNGRDVPVLNGNPFPAGSRFQAS